MSTDTFQQEINNINFLDEIEKDCRNNPELITFYEKQHGFSLLVMFLYSERLDFVEWLVDNGAEVNVSNDGTPLSMACFKGNPSIITKVYKKCNDDFKLKSCPMEQAIYSTKTTNIDALLKLGLDVNDEDKYGHTPVYHAIASIDNLDFYDSKTETCIKRQLKMLEHLILKGADLDEKSKKMLEYVFELENSENNRDILSTCTYFIEKEMTKKPTKTLPFTDLLKWLLENGANPHHIHTREFSIYDKTLKNCTPHNDLVSIESDAPLKIILEYTNPKLISEEIQFDILKGSKNEGKVRLLLVTGFNPNASDTHTTILHYCILNKMFSAAIELVQHGADIYKKDSYNRDALCFLLSDADKTNDESAIKLLKEILKKKPDLLNYNLEELLLIPNLENIFDIAVERRVYHWFESLLDYMSEEERWAYTERRLYNAMNEDNPPTHLIWKTKN